MPKPLPPATRRAIFEFNPHAPGAVSITQFCAELNISRKTYYTLKHHFHQTGHQALHPKPAGPHTPHTTYDDTTIATIAHLREHLAQQGWDNGPMSIRYAMIDDPSITAPIPSRATIARILSTLGMIDPNPRKRPRSSQIRFNRSAAMELWQLDAFVYQIPDSQTRVTIYQLIDDATRYDVGTMAMPAAENGHDALICLRQAFATYGVPKELLSDNSTAFNRARCGVVTFVHRYLASQGCKSITGRINHPQTQGKTERSHLTMQRFLDAHRPTSIDEVNDLIVNTYRPHYNQRRRHQSIGGMTPQQAWDSIEHQPSDGIPIELDEQQIRARARAADPTEIIADDALIDIRDGNDVRLRVQGYELAIPKCLRGKQYYLVSSAREYAWFDPVYGDLVLQIPLPINIPGGPGRSAVPLWKIVGVWLRNPPSWFESRRQRWLAKHGLS